MTKGAKRLRATVCGLLSFLLCLALTLLFMCVSLKLTALNASYASMIVESSNYGELMQAELKEEFISYGNACNVDESFSDELFENVITAERIDADAKNSLHEFFDNDVQEGIDTTELEEKILSALKEYAGEKGYTLTADVTENLEEMAGEMGDIYNAYVGVFSSSYFKTAAQLMSRYGPILNYAIPAFAVFAALAAIIIRLSYKKTKNFTRYYIYATAGSALMLLVAPAAALIIDIGGKINFANASLHDFASAYINYTFVGLIASAVVMAAICAMLAFVRSRAVKNNK